MADFSAEQDKVAVADQHIIMISHLILGHIIYTS